jgi:plasmid replication initiation protein
MLSEVSKMQGAYSVRIYELLTQYKSVGERSISIDDLE